MCRANFGHKAQAFRAVTQVKQRFQPFSTPRNNNSFEWRKIRNNIDPIKFDLL